MLNVFAVFSDFSAHVLPLIRRSAQHSDRRWLKLPLNYCWNCYKRTAAHLSKFSSSRTIASAQHVCLMEKLKQIRNWFERTARTCDGVSVKCAPVCVCLQHSSVLPLQESPKLFSFTHQHTATVVSASSSNLLCSSHSIFVRTLDLVEI